MVGKKGVLKQFTICHSTHKKTLENDQKHQAKRISQSTAFPPPFFVQQPPAHFTILKSLTEDMTKKSLTKSLPGGAITCKRSETDLFHQKEFERQLLSLLRSLSNCTRFSFLDLFIFKSLGVYPPSNSAFFPFCVIFI